MIGNSEFLYPRSRYRGQCSPERLAFNNNHLLSPFGHNLTVAHQEGGQVSAAKFRQQVVGQVGITLKKLSTKLLDGLTRGSEPRIIRRRDRHGHIFWRVSDPVTGYFGRFDSEAEVRCWLEQRPYI